MNELQSKNKESSTLIIGLIVVTLAGMLVLAVVPTIVQEAFAAAAPCHGPGGCTPPSRCSNCHPFYPE